MLSTGRSLLYIEHQTARQLSLSQHLARTAVESQARPCSRRTLTLLGSLYARIYLSQTRTQRAPASPLPRRSSRLRPAPARPGFGRKGSEGAKFPPGRSTDLALEEV